MEYDFLKKFFKFIYFEKEKGHEKGRERAREQWRREGGRQGGREGEREREIIPSRLCTVSAESDAGLELMNREIMT